MKHPRQRWAIEIIAIAILAVIAIAYFLHDSSKSSVAETNNETELVPS